MKKSVLLCLRDINKTQKQISDDTLIMNTQVTKMVNNKINEIQVSYFNNLLPHQKAVAMDQVVENFSNRAVLNQFINSLDINNPVTEPTEIRLDRIKLENDVETSRRIGNKNTIKKNKKIRKNKIKLENDVEKNRRIENIIKKIVRNLGSKNNRLKRNKKILVKKNSILTEKQIENVNTGLELDKLIE